MDFKTVTDVRVEQWVDIPIFFFEKSVGVSRGSKSMEEKRDEGKKAGTGQSLLALPRRRLFTLEFF